ncbi:MAG: MOSC domain-containing protein [Clostridiaceae bacterium]|nr:MOSC domain-containing protein [Clostridiaceae bacterium]
MEAKVLAVNISEKKGVIKTPVETARLIENFGIERDAHAETGSKRQVSLLGIESIYKMRAYDVPGLCEGKFAENITTQGIVLYELPVGTLLKIGETLHQVTQIGKKCHAGDGCEIARISGTCIMPKEGIFTKVLRGGVIKAGDTIELCNDDK